MDESSSSASSSPSKLPRILLGTVVIAATAYAVVLGAGAEIPKHLPGIALESPSLYREQIGLAHLLGFYAAIILIALALDGRVLVKFGKGGAEFGPVVGEVDAQRDAIVELKVSAREAMDTAESSGDLSEATALAFADKAKSDARQIAELERRIAALEDCEGEGELAGGRA